MKNRRIKLGISVFASLLIISSANASLWDSNSIFTNYTESNSVVEPNTGATYISGGALEVRFKRAGTFPPIFNVGAPSLKASCRGISFDAGYATFMNLERLGQQLAQAGTSVAYGVLIGLVYTMPGVEQAFTKLNEWSQWLQGFLNDSCSIGTNWGKAAGHELWKDTEGIKNDINNGIPSPDDYMKKHPDFKDFITTIYNSGTELQKGEFNSKVSSRVMSDAKGGVISTYINTLYSKGLENPNIPTSDMLSLVNIEGSGLTQSTIMMCYYLSTMITDIAIDESALNTFQNLKASGNADSLAAFIEELGASKSIKTLSAKNTTSPQDLISFMLNGVNSSSNLNIPGLKLAMINIDNKKGIKDKFVLLTDNHAANTTVFNDFEGYIGESKKLVYKIYNSNISQLYGTAVPNGVTISQPKVVAAYPMMFDLIRNIVLYHNTKEMLNPANATGNSMVTSLLNYIAYQNAIALANMAIDNISAAVNSNISQLSKKIKDPAVATPTAQGNLNYDIATKQLMEQKEQIENKINELRKSLFEISDNISKEQNFRNANDKIAEILRERNVRGGK